MTVCVPIKELKDAVSFIETVNNAESPVVVTKNGREMFVSMSMDVFDGMQRDAAKARLYRLVDEGMADLDSNRVVKADELAEPLRQKYGL